MLRRWILLLGCLAALMLLATALLAQVRGVPPFTVKAAKLVVILVENRAYWTGGVLFTSPRYTTKITCDRLDGNAASRDDMTMLTASGHVTVSMRTETQQEGKAVYQLDGTASKLIYSMKEGERIITMQGDAQSVVVLIITEVGAQKKPMTVKGTRITYNLETTQCEVDDPVTDAPGDAE